MVDSKKNHLHLLIVDDLEKVLFFFSFLLLLMNKAQYITKQEKIKNIKRMYFSPFLNWLIFEIGFLLFCLLLSTRIQACSCDVNMFHVIVCCRLLASLNAIASFDIKTQASKPVQLCFDSLLSHTLSIIDF
ncbi:hypothetical protein T4C_9553 [Trichinella pseudospiralis]|uniref:Uncharacterized protein n=2 Tax=Trichinella pseudospiralis TaxID=6337 RepID=A0A0V1K154_TRIPS|nr:hypothetical protein T4C_9553 [Trichinella pseudospiralis]